MKYECRKCGAMNPDFLTFMVGWPDHIRHYCLHHIPRWVRIKMWWQERREVR